LRGHDIVSGQPINDGIAERARHLRHHLNREEQIVWQALRASRLGAFTSGGNR